MTYVYKPYPKFVGTREFFKIVQNPEEEAAWYAEHGDKALPVAAEVDVVVEEKTEPYPVPRVKRKYTRRAK